MGILCAQCAVSDMGKSKNMVDVEFIQNRITELRKKKGVSEYRMSLELGHSRSYIYSIASGRALPSMQEFLVLCDYLDVTPKDFFDENMKEPKLVGKIVNAAALLDEKDLQTVASLMDSLGRKMDGETARG